MSLTTKLPTTATTAQMEITNYGDKSTSKNMQTSNTNIKTPSNNKAVNGRRRFGENGFEEGGGYMAVKKAKLDNQFNTSTRGIYDGNDAEDASEIFKGVSIYINGYTDPPEPVLREKFIRHGGTFHPYNSSKTDYVVATNLAAPTKQRYGSKTITPDWIIDSISSRMALDTRKYMLYNFNQEKNQMTLTQIMSSKSAAGHRNNEIPEVSSDGAQDYRNNGNSLKKQENSRNGDDDDTKERVSDSEEEFFECSQEIKGPTHNGAAGTNTKPVIITNGVSNGNTENDNSDSDINGTTSSDFDNQSSNESVKESSPGKNTALPSMFEKSGNNQVSPAKDKTDRIKTATDDGFLEDFFGRSRLHLISEQKKDMQLFIGNLIKNKESHKFPNLQKFESEFGISDSMDGLSFSSDDVILMHVDLDCFFVSVGLLSRPYLRGKPVVVTHSSGKIQQSKSDIACASYEARKFGVRNGMWVGEAKAMCPDLEVIPYDFEEYRRISKLFFEAVASVTLDIEPSSVDEMLIDVTSILRRLPGATPEDLATFLRKIILTETNCPASIGIGSNRLLAKLAVKLAKPDGIHYLKDGDAPAYIQSLQVRDLPGVGWSNEGKLRDLNVDTCGDLLKVPLKDLKTMFGEKTAEKMHSLCRGKDTAEIKIGLERPKSLSVDVNFGIRFTKDDEVTQFLMKICKELSSRAERIQAVSTHFTLKLLIRKKGAGDPLKHGGHGIVDSMTRSRTLMNPTRNWHEFFKTASSLVRLMRVPPTEYRGIGVIISDLAFDCDKGNKKSIQRTLTDMPISRAQKMISIITQKKSKVPLNVTSVSNNSDPDSSSAISASLVNCSSDPQSPEIVDNTNTMHTTVEQQTNNDNQSKPEMKSKATTADVSKLPVDIAVLRQLPREIAEEQCQLYGISKDLLDEVSSSTTEAEPIGEGNGTMNGTSATVDNFYDNVETVDQSFLLALPENVRQDVLIQLQEAKGRRKINDTNVVFDDEQPCSSRQALERSKKMDMDKNESNKNLVNDKVEDSNAPEPLEEQTTPIISYSNNKTNKNGSANLDPKRFWDMSVHYVAVPPKPSNRPALNKCVDVSDVRNMIRTGLEVVKDPMPAEAEHLEKYFVQLISDGWIEQTQVLLKFVHRQAVQLGEDSKWTPILYKIIKKTQERCVELYHGELEIE